MQEGTLSVVEYGKLQQEALDRAKKWKKGQELMYKGRKVTFYELWTDGLVHSTTQQAFVLTEPTAIPKAVPLIDLQELEQE